MKEYKLKELFDLQMGKTPSRNNVDYWNDPVYKWISIGDLSKSGKYISETKEYLSEKAIVESGISIIPENTVIMSFKLSIGKTAITSEPMYSNEAIMSFRDKHITELMPDYIYYLLLSKDWDVGTNKAVMGKTLNKATLSEIVVGIHDIAEQKIIVSKLDKLGTIIEERKIELQKLDELIKARFVELFGDPIRSDKYNTKKLSTCVKDKGDMVDGPFGSQVNTKVDYIENGEIPVIRTVNVKMMSFSPADLKYMTREKYETVIRSQVLPGDVILTKVGTIGNVCVFPDTFEEAVLSTTGSCRIRVDKDVMDTVFFAYNLMYLKDKLLEIASAGVQPFLNMSHVKNIDILDVPLDKQMVFTDFVKQVDKSKFVVQKSLDEAKLLFDSLMQEYFA